MDLVVNEQERQTLLDMVEDVAGPEIRKVTILLIDQDEEVTDEFIADELNIKLDEVRKSLYKLHDLEIASFRRIRDKNTGWYIYFWKLLTENINSVVIKKQRAIQWKLMERLQHEKENMFFTCGKKECYRLTFNEAMEYDFICPKCGETLEEFDNTKIIKVLELKIEQIAGKIQDNQKLVRK